MSASNEWFEHHLTPNGWVDGTEKLDSGLREAVIPEDRVLTLCFHEYLSSPFSKIELWYSEKWRHQNNDLVRMLTEKYGEIPGAYKGRYELRR